MRRVLFIGGGRRVELARMFKERNYAVYSYELDYKVPIGSEAEIIIGKDFNDFSVYNDILSVASFYDVDLIIPLMDAAVQACSYIKTYSNRTVLAPSYMTAHTCLDKDAFSRFINKEFPEFYPDLGPDIYPKIKKPTRGFGSKDISIIKNRQEDIRIDGYVYQTYIQGKEYSIDSYFDPKSRWVDSVCRERIRVGSGEVITSKTQKNRYLIDLTAEIGEKLGLVGPSNTQWIVEHVSEQPFITEVNSRFGGGSTFSMAVGMDVISLIERDYFGKNFPYLPLQWKENQLLERSYRDHYFDCSLDK